MKKFFIAMVMSSMTIYASTKKLNVIASFDACESPDSVTFSWKERPDEKTTVKLVQIQRRVAGAKEEEAWENIGRSVPGGVENVTVDGFTLDRDCEYRAVAISEVEK